MAAATDLFFSKQNSIALVILIPALLVFVVVGIRRALTRKRQDEPQESPAERTAWHFVLLLFFPCVLYLFFFKAEIGVARDWDLFALTAVALLPAALLVIRHASADNPKAVRLAFGPVLVMSAILTSAWIGINASAERAPRRLDAILAYDRSLAPYAYETLALHYYNRNELSDAIATLEKGATLSKNPRHQVMLSKFYRPYGDMDSAERGCRRLLVAGSAHPRGDLSQPCDPRPDRAVGLDGRQ